MSNTEIKEKEIELKKPFRTILDEPKITITPSGEKEEDVWEMKLDEKGNEIFYISRKTNVYEKIQAHLEETKIENILARVMDTGDTSILNRIEGNYADISEMPTTMLEANRKIKEAEKDFEKLPIEIRAKYNHNFNEYLADFGSENWIKNMGFEKKEEVKEEIKETKEEKEDE